MVTSDYPIEGVYACIDPNIVPGRLQNFWSRVPLAGYEWDSSRLNKFRLSGFIFDDAATLPNRKGYNPAERVVFNQIHFPTLKWLCLIGAEQRSLYLQARQSSAIMHLSGILSPASYVRTVTGHSPANGNGPGLSMVWLRDYDVGCWYEAWSIPMHWHVRIGNCESFNLRLYSSGGLPLKSINANHTTVWVVIKTWFAMSAVVSRYRTIRVWDVEVEVMIWYMISCGCGLILIRCVIL